MTKGRECEICGHRLDQGRWVAYQFPAALKELGFNGTWAHVNCLVKLYRYRKARQRLTQSMENDE